MNLKVIVFSALAAGLASAAAIQKGNVPQPGELDVLLTQGASGPEVTGQVGGVDALFDSTQILINLSSGQARTEALVGLLDNITLSLQGGITFGDVIFDLYCNQGCPTTNNTIGITVSDTTRTAGFFVGPGQNFITITGTDLTSVSINLAGGISDIREVSFSNIAGAATTPEPAASGLMLVGLGVVGLHRRRVGRKSRNDLGAPGVGARPSRLSLGFGWPRHL
ncbi:MAG TPA: PEP-CTERM sorting domain-containing protein [Bryobacteraceae bacterium]|nr:PEP-CTERM sorting domain-containing protein [Bryobacteraceae bacterium]